MTERAVHTAGQFDARSRADVAYLADRLEAQPTSDAVYLAACILGVPMMRPQWWLRGIVAWGSWRTGDPRAIVWARVMTRFPEIAVQTVDATVKWMRTGKDADGEGIGGFNQREIDQMARLLTPAEDRLPHRHRKGGRVMGDMIDMFRDVKTMRAAERQRLGQPCPVCQVKLPRAQPKVLLPGQWCRAHKPHYQDARSPLSDADWNAAMEGTGCSRITEVRHAG